MSAFTPAEIEYLQGQQLGRLATVNESGEPHVMPVGFRHNTELDTIDISGHNLGKSKKFRDAARTGRAAFVVDDVLPPWRPAGSRCAGGRCRSSGHGGDPTGVDSRACRSSSRRTGGPSGTSSSTGPRSATR